jgi:hypothetical protein
LIPCLNSSIEICNAKSRQKIHTFSEGYSHLIPKLFLIHQP